MAEQHETGKSSHGKLAMEERLTSLLERSGTPVDGPLEGTRRAKL